MLEDSYEHYIEKIQSEGIKNQFKPASLTNSNVYLTSLAIAWVMR